MHRFYQSNHRGLFLKMKAGFERHKCKSNLRTVTKRTKQKEIVSLFQASRLARKD
jgi:hypothetical protein